MKNANGVLLTAWIGEGDSIHCMEFSGGFTLRSDSVGFCHYYI